MYVLVIFLIIVALKFTLNTFRFIGTHFCYGRFKKQSENLAQLIPLVESLFNSAGTNMIAYQATIKTRTLSKISHFLTDKSQHESLDLAFNQTIGAYKLRMLECINPFYWMFLPRYIMESFNVFLPKILLALANFAYWIATAVASYFLEMYLELHFQDFFQHIIDRLL